MALFNKETQALVSALFMQLAAGDANSDRNVAYKKKRQSPGYKGPIIVAEGDSWFCYPQPAELTFPVVSSAPKDLVLTLGEEFAIYTEAVPGDTAWGMNQTIDTPPGLLAKIAYQQPHVLILSAGGNDLLGGGALEKYLLKGPKPKVEGYFGAAFNRRFDETVARYERILKLVFTARPEIRVVLHGYAYAVVTGPGRGPWLYEPMTRLAIPPGQHDAVVRAIVDRFHKALTQMVAGLNKGHAKPRVFLADTRNAVAADEWFDELHPSTEGFAKVAAVIRKEIARAFPLVA